MTINELNEQPVDSSDLKKEIIFGTNDELKDSLNIGDLLKEYDNVEKTLVDVKEMRDDVNYVAEYVLSKMLEFAQNSGFSDITISHKKLDKDGNIISIGLQGKSTKYNGCFGRLNFVRNCSYGDSGSDETCIIEEYYDDNSFEMPFDAEVIYKYK